MTKETERKSIVQNNEKYRKKNTQKKAEQKTRPIYLIETRDTHTQHTKTRTHSRIHRANAA